MYEWIDPWAEMERLKSEIPLAFRDGQRDMGERVMNTYGDDLSVAIHEEARNLGRDIIRRSISSGMQMQLGEMAMGYAQDAMMRVTGAISYSLSRSHSMEFVPDSKDGVRADVFFSPHNPFRDRAQEIEQLIMAQVRV